MKSGEQNTGLAPAPSQGNVTITMRLRIAIGLVIFTLLLILLAIEGFGGSWGDQLLPNLVTEMIGIILTVTVVDGLLRRRQVADEQDRAAREEADKRDRAEIAYGRMKPATESLLEPLGWIILGVQSKKPERILESIEELLSENLIRELRVLDPEAFRKRAPATVSRRVVPVIEKFGNDVAQVVDNYGVYVPPDYLKVLDNLLTSKYSRISDPFRFGESRELKTLHAHADKYSLVNFCSHVRTLVELHNKYVSDDEHKIEKMPQLFQREKKYPGEYRRPDSARPTETTRG